MYYSKTTGGFYTREIHGDNIPSDAVRITRERYAELLSAQAQGKQIKPDENGAPVAVDPPPPTNEERIQAIKAKARDVICERLPDWKQNNLTARALELTEKRAAGETLTEEEEAELLNCKAEWAWVKAVRARSDVAEQNGEQADDIVWPTFEEVDGSA